MGDFFELFGEDAETANKLLGLTLTTRDRTLTMAGFPHHQLEAYLHKLLKEGQRVAVCEPIDESLARGPIRREVTRVVTPGTKADVPHSEGRSVKQPRHFVLKKFEEWMNYEGLAFVAISTRSKSFRSARATRSKTPSPRPKAGTIRRWMHTTGLLLLLRHHDRPPWRHRPRGVSIC